MFKGKKVLVAGGTGLIGIPLVRKFLDCGAHVSVVSMDSNEFATRIFGSEVTYKRLDLTFENNCREAVAGNEIVCNMVGIKGSVGIGQSKVASYLVPMLRFQTNLMEAAFKENVSRFVFIGSICSYPQGELHLEDHMWSGMPKQNDRIPGIAKRIGELQGEAYFLEYGWDAVRILRPSNVYGPYDDFNPTTAQVIPALISRMLSGESPLMVWGDGSAKRDFIFSEDVAAWILESIINAPPNIPINLGSGSAISICDLVELLRGIISPSLEIGWDLDKPSGDPCRQLAIDRAKSLLEYEVITPLEIGLRRTVDWYKSDRDIMRLK
jgi:GDP-L-fucose synthase